MGNVSNGSEEDAWRIGCGEDGEGRVQGGVAVNGSENPDC